MKIQKIIAAFTLALLTVNACEKDETVDTKGYLTGTLEFAYPKYVAKGDSVYFKPSKVPTHPENGMISYSWKVTPGMEKDTTSLSADLGFGYRFRYDTTGTFTIACTASPAGDYYSTTTSNYVTIVEKGYKGTLPLETNAQDSLWVYEGNTYAATKIGGKYWMRSNLAAHKSNDGTQDIGVGYLNYEVMKDVFGCYYTWEEAIKACPSGWHLPTDEEWTEMAKSVKPQQVSEIPTAFKTWKKVAGEMTCYYKLNSIDMISLQADVKITDNSRLSVKMLGYANNGKYFKMFNQQAFFWTASEDSDNNQMAWCRYFIFNKADVYAEPMNKKDFCAQVRCVKD